MSILAGIGDAEQQLLEQLRSQRAHAQNPAGGRSGNSTGTGDLDGPQRQSGSLSPPSTPSRNHSLSSPHQPPRSTPTNHGSQSSPSLSAGILGRRPRTEDHSSLLEWSPRSKVRIAEYAAELADEVGMPTEDRVQFIANSQLPTHKLILISIASSITGKTVENNQELQDYLVSPLFKEHIVGKIRAILLDAKLSSYKDGILHRMMRHIRCNPAVYNIPDKFRASIGSKAFTSAVSRALIASRGDIKRKLNDAWSHELDIYAVVRSLVWNATQEWTEGMWGRWAYVHLMLVDHAKAGKPTSHFWDDVDKDLARRRALYQDLPPNDRKVMISFAFEESLKAHNKLRPSKTRQKKQCARNIPAWQLAISRAVEEMEAYTELELAEEDVGTAVTENDDGGD